ncbi:MAG: Dabb family protein [Actinomycetota bacterium]
MIRHVVLWGLVEQDPAKKAEAADFVAGQLMSLPALIPEILALTVSPNVLDADGNWDLVLLGDFADEAALGVYLTHPEHLRVVAVIKAYLAKRAAVDILV